MNLLKKYRVSNNVYPSFHEGRTVITGAHFEDYRCIYDVNGTVYLGLMHKDNLDLIVNDVKIEDRRVVIMKSERHGKVKSHENDWLIVEMDDSPIPEVVSEDEICDEDFWNSWENIEAPAKVNKTAVAVLISAMLFIAGIYAAFIYAMTTIKERNTVEYRAIDNRSGTGSTER